MDIKQQFNAISKKYDQQRRQLIPCFDDFYKLPLEVIDCPNPSPRILDIGSGTGLFTSFVLEKYPKASFTLIDFSDDMLDVAKERFAGNENFEYIAADYTKHCFNEKFDIIISALSIHHLTAEDKETLYAKCFSLLSEGGVFVNADQVLSPHPAIEATFYDRIWKSVQASDLPSGDIEKARERVKLDDPSTLADQLDWLRKAGFKEADCLYKYYSFCVILARK